MSQPSQCALGGPINLPLLKFSWATDPADATKFAWKHTMQHLLLVFDNYGANRYNQQPSSVMKVLQGANVLEQVDLVEKIQLSNAAMDHARQFRIQLKNDQLPTAGLYRRMQSTIAIRYQFPDQKVRRIQLKFSSVQDFDAALSVLQNLGCPLHNSAPAGEAETLSRPTTAASTSCAPVAAPSPSRPFHIPENANDKPVQPVLAPLYVSLQSPGEKLPNDSDRRPYTSNSEHFPISQHVYRSFTSPAAPPPQAAHASHSSSMLAPIKENEQSFYSDPVLQNIGAVNPKLQRVDPFRPRAATSYANQNESSFTNSDPSIPVTSKAGLVARTNVSSHFFAPVGSQSTQRPSTAPMSALAQLDNDLSTMIPPRRDLPFKRASSSRDGGSSRPSTATDLPALPKPSFIKPSLNSNQTLQKPTNLLVESVVPEEFNQPMITPNPKRRPSTAGNKRRKASESTKRMPSKPPSRSELVLAGSSTNLKSSPPRRNIERSNSPLQIDKPTVSLQAGSSSTEVIMSNSSLITQTDKIPSSVSHVPESNVMPIDQHLNQSFNCIQAAFSGPLPALADEKENLVSYALMPYSERMEVVEQMIVNSVSDDNFITLCEDVYGCWQRIGLSR